MLVDQLVFAPFMISGFFTFTSALEGKSAEQIKAKLRRDWLPAVKGNYVLWPAAQLINFTFVPQVNIELCFSFLPPLNICSPPAASGRAVRVGSGRGLEHVAVLDERKGLSQLLLYKIEFVCRVVGLVRGCLLSSQRQKINQCVSHLPPQFAFSNQLLLSTMSTTPLRGSRENAANLASPGDDRLKV